MASIVPEIDLRGHFALAALGVERNRLPPGMLVHTVRTLEEGFGGLRQVRPSTQIAGSGRPSRHEYRP